MKMDVMPSLVQMEKEELQKLIAEVKETVATVIQLPEANQKTFGHLDMWNIRRNFKTTGDLLSRK